jgi:hypothetical protein
VGGVTFATGGLACKAGQNVGIGTWVPPGRFTIKAPANNVLVNLDTNGHLGIGTTDTSRAAIAVMTGNVGIGTVHPGTALEVYESAPTDGPMEATGNNASSTYGVDMYVGGVEDAYIDQHGQINIWVVGNESMIFGTHNTEAMRIDNNGNVGIGTTSPINLLDVNGGVAVGAYAGIDTAPTKGLIVSGNVGIGTTLTGKGALSIMNGNVGIGTWVPAFTIQVVGTAALSSGQHWSVVSDMRLKDILGDYKRGLDDVLKLHTVRFVYKKNNALGLPPGIETIGFIAQEVLKVIPEAVSTGSSGYLQLNVDPIHWAMVNAIQEFYGRWKDGDVRMQDRIGVLKQRIDNLKLETKALLDQNRQLHARLDKLDHRITGL